MSKLLLPTNLSSTGARAPGALPCDHEHADDPGQQRVRRARDAVRPGLEGHDLARATIAWRLIDPQLPPT